MCPKRLMREYLEAREKYEKYKKECEAKGESVLPFELWEKREIDRAWEEGLKQAGFMIIDLGSVKICTWTPEKKKDEAERKEGERVGG
ncbi:MAG: hypothetical protein QXH91_05075 [Candidatus Bathyarchaeia archaeon]